jgi:hypothetical protein
MPFPASAFIETYARDLEPGRLFQFHGHWAMLVRVEALNDKYFVMLQGERIGSLHKVVEGMAKSLALSPHFSWFAAVASVGVPKRGEHHPACLLLLPDGPVLLANEKDGFGDIEYYAFGLDGLIRRDVDLHSLGMHLLAWSAELEDPARPGQSLGTLVSIDSTAPGR